MGLNARWFRTRRAVAAAGALALSGSLLLAAVAEATPGSPEDHSRDAELYAAFVLIGMTLLLLAAGRTVRIARTSLTKTIGGVERTVRAGGIVPDEAKDLTDQDVESKRLPLLRYLLVGKDNRLSTSKSVALAWTYVVVWGLLALLWAQVLGDSTGWDRQIHGKGLQEEYLLLLGGPYAAAVIAKYRNVTSGSSADKTVAPVGKASAGQLVSDDRGETDLVDFQYVVFNFVAIAYVLADMIPHLRSGFPDLPATLTGLAVTSVAGYSAKKLVAQGAPKLLSLSPKTAPVPAAGDLTKVEVWTQNAVIPASATDDEKSKPPIVTVGPYPAKVASIEETLGSERLTVEIEVGALAGEHLLRVLRADGAPAKTESGIDGLALTLTDRPAAR